jgi:hypothetical protein
MTKRIQLGDGERKTVHTAAGEVRLRRKGDWHPLHVWMPLGIWLLTLIGWWEESDRDYWYARMLTSARCPLAVYIGTEADGVSRRGLLHEVRHFLQAMRELFYSIRYAGRRFRLRMEAEAYVAGSELERDQIIQHLTSGQYGRLGADVVEQAVDDAIERYGWEVES